jgi:hypothetical protein
LADGNPVSQFIFEVGDCGKGALHKAAKFLFAPSDYAEGDVLENAVVDEKGKNPFRILGRIVG